MSTTTVVIIAIGGITSLSGFFVGILTAIGFMDINEKANEDEGTITHNDRYCFECEIEMPVREKKDRLYCSNCGLYHGSI